jgi:hypothetical protein
MAAADIGLVSPSPHPRIVPGKNQENTRKLQGNRKETVKYCVW